MKTAIKTNYPKFVDLADFEEELENKFLDKQAPKSVSVPQGSFDRPTVPTVKTESRGGVPILEGLIFCFFSFCLGFWLGISHVQGVLKSNRLNMLIEQISFYLVIGIIPSAWIVLSYLYFKKRR